MRETGGWRGERRGCAGLARASPCVRWCRQRWEVEGVGDAGIARRESPACVRGCRAGRQAGAAGACACARGGGVSRARCTSRAAAAGAAAAGRWGKRGVRQGWVGVTLRGTGWWCGLLPSLFAAGLRRTPLVAHFSSSSAGGAGPGTEWPYTPSLP